MVDDHPLAREIIAEILRDLTFSVTLADSGAAALDEFMAAHTAEKPYSLVFVDWKMPGMDGIETIQQIRTQDFSRKDDNATLPAVSTLKIIMMTAFGKESLRKKSIEADLFINKPLSYTKLWCAVIEVFGETVCESHFITSLTEEHETRSKIGGARILLVEDNGINQQVAEEILRRVGLVVDIANNGLEALRMLDEASYDAVLMDLRMPEMDGFTATSKLRSEARFQKLPIIAMTAHTLDKERKRCFDVGMNAHLGKPIQPEKLYAILVQWIGPIQHPSVDGEIIAVADITPIPEIPGINQKEGLQRVSNNRKLYRKLLTRFYEENHDAGDKLNKALMDGDLEQGVNLAHNIKGIAGNLGAYTLHQASSALEKVLAEGDAQQQNQCVITFTAVFNELINSLASLEIQSLQDFSNATHDGDVSVDLAQLKPLLAKLNKLLQESNLEAETVVAALKVQLKSGNVATLFQELEEEINNYDFDAAQQSLAKISNFFEPHLGEE